MEGLGGGGEEMGKDQIVSVYQFPTKAYLAAAQDPRKPK